MADGGIQPSQATVHLYNGKELQDELGLGWYDYGARMLNPTIGRWNGVDALAAVVPTLTTYSYVGGNPISQIDPDGNLYTNELGLITTEASADGRQRVGRTESQLDDMLREGLGNPPKNQKIHEDGNVGHQDDASLDEVSITAKDVTTFRGMYRRVELRRRMGLSMDGYELWERSYDNYMTGRFSPRTRFSDAVTYGVDGSFIFGGGAEESVGITTFEGRDPRLTNSTGGGLGYDVGVGASLTWHWYNGPNRSPDLGAFEGRYSSTNLNLYLINVEFAGDLSISERTGNKRFGANWTSLKVGVGFYGPSFVPGIFNASQTVGHTSISE